MYPQSPSCKTSCGCMESDGSSCNHLLACCTSGSPSHHMPSSPIRAHPSPKAFPKSSPSPPPLSPFPPVNIIPAAQFKALADQVKTGGSVYLIDVRSNDQYQVSVRGSTHMELQGVTSDASSHDHCREFKALGARGYSRIVKGVMLLWVARESPCSTRLRYFHTLNLLLLALSTLEGWSHSRGSEHCVGHLLQHPGQC